MRKRWIVVLIVAMLGLSLLFLNWSGIIKLYPSWASSPNFPHLKSLYLNRQGNAQLKAENYASAFDSYVKTLEFDPFSPETHLDLGLSYEGQQQSDKAMSSYQNAEKYAKDDEVKFMAYFNQAQLFGKGKKIDEALAFYQKALEMDPTSKETKTNIELLIQMQQQQGKGGDSQDQKDQQQQQQDQQNQKDQKDGKDPKDQQDGKDKKEQPKQYAPNQKPKPRQFKGQELSEGDVKKILGEIKQQEQKIRSEYNRKEVKEQGRDKDW